MRPLILVVATETIIVIVVIIIVVVIVARTYCVRSRFNEGDFTRLMPKEFLKRVPGVTSNNITVIMKSVKNIIELVRLPEDSLKELVGPKSAKLIKNFFETKVGGGLYGDSDEEEVEQVVEKVGEYEKFKQQ